MQYAVRLPQPVESATVSFKFKFDGGYDWTAGGKLGPGMCSEGEPPTPHASSVPVPRLLSAGLCSFSSHMTAPDPAVLDCQIGIPL